MNFRAGKTVVALALCGLAICAVGVTSASAAGMTAVKCVEVGAGEGNYNNSQCLTPKSEGGSWDTVQIAETTEIEGKGTTSGHGLGSTNSPVAVEYALVGGQHIMITCGKSQLAGKVTNLEEEGGKMKIHGTELVMTAEECHAGLESDPTKICTVQGVSPATAVGSIQTNALTSTTTTEHTIKIEPEAASSFNEFKVNPSGGSCFTKSTLSVKTTGAILGHLGGETHAHITFTTTTNGTEFKANGAAVTLESTLLTYMKGSETETVGAETF